MLSLKSLSDKDDRVFRVDSRPSRLWSELSRRLCRLNAQNCRGLKQGKVRDHNIFFILRDFAMQANTAAKRLVLFARDQFDFKHNVASFAVDLNRHSVKAVVQLNCIERPRRTP